MFSNDRNRMRQVFFAAWQKKQQNQELSALEQMLVQVMLEHPEYHPVLNDPDAFADRDWTPEQGQTNPFLHMAMHLGIHEQLAADMPTGIKLLYQQLLGKFNQPHDLEHKMMDCLGQALWQAQASGREPDMHEYLACLKKLL